MFAADRASWQNPRVLATLVLVFLSGALAGAITMRAGMHQRMQRGANAYWQEGKNEFSYDMLKRELKLSAEQSERLKTILDDFVKYHEDLQAQIEDVRATGKNRIMQMLDARQRQRFEELCNQLPSQ
jgi:Spy/CpxP family protein refolding chaperone